MARRDRQLKLLKDEPKAYGGDLRRTRKGREGGRPLATRSTMHLVLRSSKARGDWSFQKTAHKREIRRILKKFSDKYGVKVLSLANVGNHLHLQIKLARRATWNPFIRALTAAIAMAVTGGSRWNRGASQGRFWDCRPFTRVLQSWREYLTLKDYIEINQLEGIGHDRGKARWIVKSGWAPEEANSA